MPRAILLQQENRPFPRTLSSRSNSTSYKRKRVIGRAIEGGRERKSYKQYSSEKRVIVAFIYVCCIYVRLINYTPGQVVGDTILTFRRLVSMVLAIIECLVDENGFQINAQKVSSQ